MIVLYIPTDSNPMHVAERVSEKLNALIAERPGLKRSVWSGFWRENCGPATYIEQFSTGVGMDQTLSITYNPFMRAPSLSVRSTALSEEQIRAQLGVSDGNDVLPRCREFLTH